MRSRPMPSSWSSSARSTRPSSTRFARALPFWSVEPPLTLEVELLGRRPAGRFDRRSAAARHRSPRPRGAGAAGRARRRLDRRERGARRRASPPSASAAPSGGEMHTPDEFIEIASLETGREQLRSVLASCSGRVPRPMITRRIRSTRSAPTSSSARSPACAASASSPGRALRQRRAARPRQGRARRLARRRGAAAARGGARGARRRPHATRRWSTSPATRSSPGSTSLALTRRSRRTNTPRPRWRSRPTRAFAPRSSCAACRPRAGDGRHLVGRPVRGARPAVGRALAWLRSDLTGDNGYARPDRRPARDRRPQPHAGRAHRRPRRPARPRGARRLPRRRRAPYRDDLRPIEVAQPEGTSLAAGRTRAQLGPVARAHRLQPARVADAARARLRRGRRRRAAPDRAPALDRRARHSLCRHHPTVVFKNAFDIGEYGLGRMANSLALGCDCLGEIRYLDALVVDSRARADDRQRHLRAPGGHRHPLEALRLRARGATEVRRARRLVVSFIVTVGNYEYGFYWYLYLDGRSSWRSSSRGFSRRWRSRRASAGATASLIGQASPRRYHQHFFCARLDLDVDGRATPSTRSMSCPTRRARTTRWATRSAPGDMLERESERVRPSTRAAAVPGGSPTRHPTALVSPSRTSCCLADADLFAAPDSGRRRARLRDAAPVGHAVRAARALCRRRLPEPVRRAVTACRAGRPPIARSTTPMSCSGTCSGHPRAAARGLAGHAGRVPRLHASPFGFFDRNPALDVPPPAGALPPPVAQR